MARFKNDKGLTLIELLITIAVLAVVSAIALPVINNVVSSSNSNAAAQTQSDVNDFIAKYNASGETLFVSSATTGSVLSGYVDTDGDNTIDSNELVDTLTIDSKFTISAAGTSDNVGGNYTADGITGATIALASTGGSTGGSNAAPSGYQYTLTVAPWGDPTGDLGGSGSCNATNWNGADLAFYCFYAASANASNAFNSLTSGDPIEVTYSYGGETVTQTVTFVSVYVGGSPATIDVVETLPEGGTITGLRM